MKIAYVGNFSQPHCTEVHLAKTLENLGHNVTRIQETPTLEDANWHSAVIAHDMFLYTRTWGNMVTLEDLRIFKQAGIPTVSYHLDLYVGLQREVGLNTDPFWRTDYVFSPDGDPASQAFFESKGINHFYMKPGVFKDECVEIAPNNDQSLSGEVIFVGGGVEYGHKEWPYRHELVKWLGKNYTGYRKYGHPQRTVRNMELNQLYANADIVVGDSLCLGFKHPYYWSDRVYETIGRGGFIIHPYIEGMAEEFIDGENIVFYEFNNWGQLKEKIDYYLQNEAERKRIQHNGFEFVRDHATYNNRLQQMLDIVAFNEYMKSKVKEAVETSTTDPNTRYSKFDSPESLKINLGAGQDQFEGYVNVDFVQMEGIDVVHNLMDFPYPFADSCASEIKAVDVVEHLANYTDDKRPSVIAFVEECWRILKPGGELYIQTPGWKADFLWIDPTHVRGFDIQTFDFFDPTTHYGSRTGFYSKCKFKVRAEELPNHNLRFWMTKI